MAQSANQGIPVGFVSSVSGNVGGLCVSRNLDVEEYTLEVGDPVFAHDILRTGADSTLIVQMQDGSNWNLGPLARVEVDPSMLPGEQQGEETRLASEESLLLEPATGINFEQLEPTAAGGGPANDDGTSVVILDRGTESDPYQAFDTPGVDTEGRQFVLDAGDVIVPEDAIITASLPASEPPLRVFGGGFEPGTFGKGPAGGPSSGSFSLVFSGDPLPVGDPVLINP